MAQEIADSTLLDTWSSGGNIEEPDISKIIEGWQLGEQPPHEYMNWIQNTFGSKLNHILKNGVAKWESEKEFLAGATVQHNGNVWLCKTTNTNSAPTDVNANWKRIITVESLATLLTGYVATTGDQDIDDIKTFLKSPIVPTPTTGTQVANKDYVDDTSNLNLSAKVDKAKDISGDIDLALTGGIYAYTTNLTNVPTGAGTAGSLLVLQGITTTARSQLLISLNGNMFFRYGDSGGWNSWGQLVNKSDFIQSLTTEGYQKLPSGLILQWGVTTSGASETSGTETFPIAFPNACFGVQITNNGTNNSGYVTTFNTTSFTWGIATSAVFRYFAIGY